jgi:hypothetical protein
MALYNTISTINANIQTTVDNFNLAVFPYKETQ